MNIINSSSVNYSMLMLMVGLSSAISVILLVLQIIGLWNIFKKAGTSGWKALIPFYNMYTLCKIVWGNGWYFLLSFVPVGNIIFYIATLAKLAKCFRKGVGYTLGLIFLTPIFLLILGVKRDTYYIGYNNKGKVATIVSTVVTGVISIIITFMLILTVGVFFIGSMKAISDYATPDYNSSTNYSSEYNLDDTELDNNNSNITEIPTIKGNDGFLRVPLKNAFGDEVKVPVFDSDDNFVSDSYISSSKDGISLCISYQGYVETDPEKVVNDYIKDEISYFEGLDFYKDVYTDNMFSGEGWALQQINYKYIVGEEEYPSLIIIKADIVNDCPVIIKIILDGFSTNENSKSTFLDVCDVYGIEFRFD